MSSVTPNVTTEVAEQALDRLVELGEVAEPLFREARATHQRYVVLMHSHHPNSSGIDYWRGRWHSIVMALAALGGLELSSNEADLLEFIQVLLARFER